MDRQDAFPGFERPGANFVLTPNQYLDLCVPHCSRGVVRIVGYLIRQVLGWSDRQGRPLRETVRVSYSRIVRDAGVSRGAARAALEEAEAAGFIVRTRAGSPNRAGVRGEAAEFALRWDEPGDGGTPRYAEELDGFAGFYTGEGRRTMVPNAFFDRVLPAEPHGVTKVVAAVLRHTVGYTNRYTGLPQESAPLSYRKLIGYAAMDRRTVRRALPAALAARYVRVVSTGRFSPGEAAGEASVYAVCWRDGQDGGEGDGSLLPPAPDGTESGSVQKRPLPERSEMPPADGPASPPATVQECPPEAFKKAPTRKTPSKTTQTQPEAAVLPSAAPGGRDAGAAELIGRLRATGLGPKVAARLLDEHGAERVTRQLDWLTARGPARNAGGMLRRAIEEDWDRPTALPPDRPRSPARPTDEDDRRARERHEHRHRDAHLAALADAERRLRERRPNDYARFVEERATARQRLEAEAVTLPPRVRQRVLDHHDRDEARLTELAARFPTEVPDFWTWDRQQRGTGAATDGAATS